MPITESVKKALRQSRKRQKRNSSQKKNLQGLEKKLKILAGQKKKEEAEKTLAQLFKFLDKAAKTGLIKKNKASRKKARLSRGLSGAIKA